MREIKLIANPMAGRGRGRTVIPLVAAILKREGLSFSLSQTEYPGHAVELARQAVADGYETLVALGGDGTVHEVLNGMCADLGDEPNPGATLKFGVIPAGSGNDFAFAVGLPPDSRLATLRLINGESRLVDLGRVNGQLFAYGAGMGFDAEVNIESRKIKWLRGMVLYLIALIKVMIFSHHSYQVEITFDGERVQQQAMMVSVANGRRYAGAFLVTPDAEIDDGLLNLCIVAKVSRLEMLRLVPLFLTGYHTKMNVVRMASAKRVSVRSSKPIVSHLDGEIFGLNEVRYDFSLLPKCLRVIC